MFINQLLNAIIQIIVFAIIPFVWWLITARKKQNFFSWIGLKKPVCENPLKGVILIIICFVGAFVLGQIAIYFRGEMEVADSAYKGMGAAAIPSIMAYSYGQTGFSEELLFRGFLLKRLSNKFGFWPGNMITAAIFGVIHLTMVWGHVNILSGTLIVVYPMVVAIMLGWINERKFDGSIIPSWLIHGTINTLECTLQAFM